MSKSVDDKTLVEFGNILLKAGPGSLKELGPFANFLFSDYREKMFKDHPQPPNKNIKESMSTVYHSDLENYKVKFRRFKKR